MIWVDDDDLGEREKKESDNSLAPADTRGKEGCQDVSR